MKIAVIKETLPGEARVALMPDSVKKLVALKASVIVERNAGLGAARSDDDYREAGAEVIEDRESILKAADLLAVVNRPSAEDFHLLHIGAVVLGFLRPLDEPAALTHAVAQHLTTFAVELIPRITRAQAMDYAVELSEEALQRGRDLIAEHAKTADLVITTAQVPGRRAPLLMTEEAVNGMKRGSAVIDLAGSTGGNCALSQPDEIVERNGVAIMAPTNLAATVPVHASQLYSRNVTSFLSLLIKDGELSINMEDDVVGPSCVTHDGKIVNSRVASILKQVV